MQETQVPSLGWKDPLEDKMATHFSLLAGKIPWTEEPGRLQSMGVTKSYNWVIEDTHTIEICPYHILCLVCISLMTNDVEYLCMCLLVLHKYKCSSWSFFMSFLAHFSLDCLNLFEEKENVLGRTQRGINTHARKWLPWNLKTGQG